MARAIKVSELPKLPQYKMRASLAGSLVSLYRLLSKPSRWTKGNLERKNAKGQPCQVCLVGGILHVTESSVVHGDLVRAIHEAIPARSKKSSIEGYNDARKTRHRDILALIRRAAKNNSVTLPAI